MRLWVRLLIVVLFTLALNSRVAAKHAESGLKSAFVTTADDVRIHYLEAGTAKRAGRFQTGGTPRSRSMTKGEDSSKKVQPLPSILFVPGWTMPTWMWDPQIQYFSKDYRVVAMDPRCQGKSAQTTDGFSPAARARDIKAIVDKLNLAPVVLVGWSLAVEEVASYVDQFGTKDIACIVLVDEFFGADVPAEQYKEILEFFNGFVQDRRTATDSFVRSLFKKPQPEDYIKHVVKDSLKTPTNTAVMLLFGWFGTDVRPALKKIDKPTLVCAAATPYQNLVIAVQQRIPGSRLEVFEDAGHALFVDDSDRFNTLLDGFMRTIQNSTQGSAAPGTPAFEAVQKRTYAND